MVTTSRDLKNNKKCLRCHSILQERQCYYCKGRGFIRKWLFFEQACPNCGTAGKSLQCPSEMEHVKEDLHLMLKGKKRSQLSNQDAVKSPLDQRKSSTSVIAKGAEITKDEFLLRTNKTGTEYPINKAYKLILSGSEKPQTLLAPLENTIQDLIRKGKVPPPWHSSYPNPWHSMHPRNPMNQPFSPLNPRNQMRCK